MTVAVTSSRRFSPAPLIAGVLLLWLYLLYGRSLWQMTPQAIAPSWAFAGPFMLTTDFLNPLFWSPLTFIGSYVVGFGLILWAVHKFPHAFAFRLLLFSGGLVALLFPLMMPFAYGQYQLLAQPMASHELRWVTKPTNRYSSAYKQAQVMHEGNCAYNLAGWATNSTLYYRSACWPGLWRYDLLTRKTTWSFFAREDAQVNNASVQRWNGYSYLPHPEHLTGAGEYPFLTLEKALSPDGKWEAVLMRRIYGPSDIVVVSQSH